MFWIKASDEHKLTSLYFTLGEKFMNTGILSVGHKRSYAPAVYVFVYVNKLGSIII